MTKDEAIKYLQQIYPNDGYYWLDEQRIEAIGMAIQALQEEPASEDLEAAALMYLSKYYDTSVIWDEDKNCVLRDFKAGAKWQLAAFVEKVLAYLNERFYFNNLHYAVENNIFNCMEEMFDDFRKYMEGE